MSDWKVIAAKETTNELVNPQFYYNITDGWAQAQDGAGAAWARDTTRQWIGVASAKITAGTASARLAQSVTVANGETIYLQARAWEGTVAHARLRLYDTTNAAVRANTDGTLTGQWELLQIYWLNDTGAPAVVSARLQNIANDSASEVWWDAALCEIDTTGYTTYCDGDQEGCRWNGARHNSTSTRSGVSRAGGLVQDLVDDYSLDIEAVLGAAMAPRVTSRDGYAQLPGGALNNSVRASRTLTLVGTITGTTTLREFHAKRKALVDLFNPEAFPQTDAGWQPVILRYTGGTTEKEIKVHYEAGLEGDNSWMMPFNERVAIRFFAPDPNWYAAGETSTALDTNDTATLRYVAGRLQSTGQWDDLGLTANPTTNGTVWSVCVTRDNYVYVGGDFTGLNGVAGRDYIARYTPETDTWSTVVGASDVNGVVYAMQEAPDGKIYIGGAFTNVDGIAAADYLAVYDPVADTWAAVGVPNTGAAMISSVRCIAFDRSGNLYVGGSWLTWADVPDAHMIAKWDGTTWTAVGATAVAATAHTIAIDNDNNVFVGGDFTNLAGIAAADKWAWWDATAAAWKSVDDIALNNTVLAMVFDDTGNLYVGGAFTDADSVVAADYIFRWTGTAVESIGTPDNTVFALAIAPDGKLWASGSFTDIDGISLPDRIAAWNYSTWVPIDVDLPGTPQIYAIAFSQENGILSSNHDTYVGFSTTGSAYFSGAATVTNDGSVPAYPRVTVSRSGGTSARLISIRNETTGKQLYCDYAFVDGEVLTIDTSPDAQTVESSFFDSRLDAVLPGSDWSEFNLLPGENVITAFINVVGAPTVTANILVKTPFDGVDD